MRKTFFGKTIIVDSVWRLPTKVLSKDRRRRKPPKSIHYLNFQWMFYKYCWVSNNRGSYDFFLGLVFIRTSQLSKTSQNMETNATRDHMIIIFSYLSEHHDYLRPHDYMILNSIAYKTSCLCQYAKPWTPAFNFWLM